MNNIFIKPLITEKSMQDASIGRYTFEVNIDANKNQIRTSAKNTFGVDVVSVKTITLKGTSKRVGKKRLTAKTSSWKKAIIQVKPGQKIDLFDTTENAKKL